MDEMPVLSPQNLNECEEFEESIISKITETPKMPSKVCE
jgi:hypothetical protein